MMVYIMTEFFYFLQVVFSEIIYATILCCAIPDILKKQQMISSEYMYSNKLKIALIVFVCM